MRRSLFVLLAVMVSIPLANCGGGTPTGPTPPPPPTQTVTYTVKSLDPDVPVAGAQVQVGTQSFTTNGSGEFTMPQSASKTDVSVKAAGYLDHLTDTSKGTAITLFPLDRGVTAEFVRDLVYRRDSGAIDPFQKPSGTYHIVPEGELANDYLLRICSNAGKLMARAFPGVDFVATLTPPSGAQLIRVQYLPGPTWSGGPTTAGSKIVGGSISVGGIPTPESESSATRIMAHELGHVMGLKHISEPGLMAGATTAPMTDFSEKERRVIEIIMRRPAGTKFPDDIR